MDENRKFIKGRGSSSNPHNRFETVHVELDPEVDPNDQPKPRTLFLRDSSKSFITYNDSPDVGFSAGINPYRGCEHGCVYCFARPSHEYLSMSSGIDFESKILVKVDAANILRKELSARKYQPQPIALSGNTDCYQPVERKLRITRQCLEVFADFRNPVGMITKNALICRDVDILKQLNEFRCIKVFISLTSLNSKLISRLEPRASCPLDRLRTIQTLADAGIPVGVMIAPIIPGLTDEEIPALLKSAADAGAQTAGHIIVRLPYAVKDLFQNWLKDHYPERSDRILNRIRSIRGGKLNDPNFKTRMSGVGFHADQIHQMFSVYKKRYGLDRQPQTLTTENFRRSPQQFQLFD